MAKKVTIRGKALDAKAGAVIMVEGSGPVYIEGLDSWPREAFGKAVVATGVLTTKKYIPDPVGEDGEIRQGAEGEQEVLEGATWKLERQAGRTR